MTNRRGRKAPALDCRLRPVLSGACLIGLTQPGLDVSRGSGAADEAISVNTPVKNCNETPHRSGAERHPGHRRARCHGGGQALLPPDDRTQRTAPRLTAALEIHRPAMPVSIVTATAPPTSLSTSDAAAQERRPDHAGEAKATVAENGAKRLRSTRRTKRRARCHRRTAGKRRPVMATKGKQK